MALVSAMRNPIATRMAKSGPPNPELALTFVWASFLTLLIAGPWLLPGYLFGTDWPGARWFHFPAEFSSAAPLQAILAVVAAVIGGEATGKFVILGLIFCAAALAYRAVPVGGFVARAAASTVFVVNPFVYGRLHYGQMFLLAAYAALPWALLRLRHLLVRPGARSALGAAAAYVLVGIFSPHVLLIAGLVAVALYVAHVIARHGELAFLSQSGRWVIATVAVALLASSYWVIPLIAGRGYEAGVISATGAAELTSYAAKPDISVGLVPNLLGLYGFWAEGTGRFTSMKAFIPLWPAVLTVLLLICAFGAIVAFRERHAQMAPWVAGLLVAVTCGLVLEIGISHPLTSGLVNWLDAHVRIYRGMRDAGKWAALLALVYSQLTGLGAAAILSWAKKSARNPMSAEWAAGLAAALLLALPLYYGNGLLFGAHGEIKPSQYPAGWYSADRVLLSDANPGRTLFLPWHEYMRYSFIQNQNSVVAAPAPSFFSVPVLASTNPEVPGIAPPASSDQSAVASLVQEGSKGRWADVLGSLNVRYILVAKELDWQSYSYLDTQTGLTRVGDYGQIILFRVG
jgi:hypothetical protein